MRNTTKNRPKSIGKTARTPTRRGWRLPAGRSCANDFGQLRGDEVAAAAFGVRRMRSCDAVRRFVLRAALKPATGLSWAWEALFRSVVPLLPHDYALDLDPTVKPLYGHQEGAERGYNPHKPGRPSHSYHTMVLARPPPW